MFFNNSNKKKGIKTQSSSISSEARTGLAELERYLAKAEKHQFRGNLESALNYYCKASHLQCPGTIDYAVTQTQIAAIMKTMESDHSSSSDDSSVLSESNDSNWSTKRRDAEHDNIESSDGTMETSIIGDERVPRQMRRRRGVYPCMRA